MKIQEASRIADIVNNTGGRLVPIIVVETCSNCGEVWFGQPQDRGMRERIGVPTLCPGCKKESDKAKRRKS